MSLPRLAEASLPKYGAYVSLADGKILRKELREQS